VTFFEPNTTGTIARPVTTDNAKGDPVETPVTVAEDVPALLREQRQRVWSPTEQRASIVESWTAVFRPGTDIVERDHYTTTDGVFFVETVERPTSGYGGDLDVHVILKRVRA
jgi:hypothetical protein